MADHKYSKYITLRNQNGNSIIQVLIAIGLTAIMALTIASLITDANKNLNNLTGKIATLELQQATSRMLGDYRACECIFQNLAWAPNADREQEINSIRNGCNTGNYISKDQLVPSSKNIRVANMKLANMQMIATGKYSANLRIEFSAPLGTIAPASVEVLGLNFIIAGGNIVTCKNDDDAENICTNLGGTLTSGVCIIRPNAQSCPAGQFVSGIRNDGTYVCQIVPASPPPPPPPPAGGYWDPPTWGTINMTFLDFMISSGSYPPPATYSPCSSIGMVADGYTTCDANWTGTGPSSYKVCQSWTSVCGP